MVSFKTAFLAALMAATSFSNAANDSTGPPQSLAGTWRFQLDPKGVGIGEKWFARKLDDTVRLPGTTDDNHKGIQTDERPTDRLARVWSWKGAAWYQRDFEVPSFWAGKRVTLFLERTKNSRVWIDGVFCGRENTLSAPHVFDITKAATPGNHTITILIDNSKLPPVGPAHQVDERTQTNWNGIVGKMELRATDPVWIDDVQIYPNAAKRNARVRAVIGNSTGKKASGRISVSCRSYNVCEEDDFAASTVEMAANDGKTVVEFTYEPGKQVPLWSEFNPALLRMELKFDADVEGMKLADTREVRFAMREFTHDGALLKNNGTTVFLRGRLDCANYPLTGYAPMDKVEWRRIYGILKDWGLNHVRFHSWCPPEAAFEAADELGFYLQAELPNKRSAFNAADSKEAAQHNIDFLESDNMDNGISLFDYGKREGELILRHFGNHPSFMMFTLGNELGRSNGMFELVQHFKSIDPRHLYAQGSNNMHWAPSLATGDDFWVTGKVEKAAKPLRGSFSFFDFPNPHIETFPPSTMVDFSKSIEGVPVPLIGHETGQFQVYPDFRDIPKFTGVLRARNYEIFRERLEKTGMLDQAGDFVKSSGALAAICYREDIEAALRTPGFGGFQLLDIMDFPGQGTALVGMLNVFMESKGVIDPKDWREFCNATVPLIRMEKYAWKSDETFTGKVQIAHYGMADFPSARITATMSDAKGGELARATFDPVMLRNGSLNEVGEFRTALSVVGDAAPVKLTLTLAIEGTSIRNRYPVWVYPPKVDNSVPEGVLLSRSLADALQWGKLEAGGRVLLIPEPDKLPRSVPGGFQCEFWSPMFAEAAAKRGEKRMPPGTLGILCDPKSPALADFPTEFHSNWQWWYLVRNSRPIVFDGTSPDFRPTVQVIDNFARNQKLGLIAETKIGNGAMLICSIDLPGMQDKPEARQLLHSLLQYVGSSRFDPKTEIPLDVLKTLLP